MQLHHDSPYVVVVGAGLAGSEAAWQLAERGVRVRLYEMRPENSTLAHTGSQCAELVCSNSFKSLNPSSAAGCLKAELAAMGSFVLRCALEARVPAGGALAVDREVFSALVTAGLASHQNIEMIVHEVRALEELEAQGCESVIVATGPLTSDALAISLEQRIGVSSLSFYDAAAPIVAADSLDHEVLFAQSRYGRDSAPCVGMDSDGDPESFDPANSGDYLNAPFSREAYERFVAELLKAECVIKRDFERKELFAACQPVEEVARTGTDALRFGALKPVGLTDPATGRRPWATVQLRAENQARTAYNLVGFQTNLTFSQQQRVFRLIPGLEQAEFVRYGVMHRNTFVDAPHALGRCFELPAEFDEEPIAPSGDQERISLIDSTCCVARPQIILAGQLTGTEGYTEAIASGLLAALNTYARMVGVSPVLLPPETCFGALAAYATDPSTRDYQPMHVNYGIMPALEQPVRNKRNRFAAYASRARTSLAAFIDQRPELCFQPPFELPIEGVAED